MAIVLSGGTVIDGNGGTPMNDAAVVIEGEQITQVGPAAHMKVDASAQYIDTTGKTVMPGMVDGHIHICGDPYPDPAYPLKDLPAYAPIRGVAAARKMLEMGFTAGRSMADLNFSGVALNQAIKLGIVPGPRLVAAGEMVVVDASASGGWIPPQSRIPQHRMFTGPDDARRAVRWQLLNGADFIETMIGGPVGTNGPIGLMDTEWTFEEMQAAADEAHRRGKRIGVNCYSDETVITCINAGFDIIEHGCLVTERGLEAMVKAGTFFVPTLCAYHAYIAPDAEQRYPAWRLARGRPVGETLRERFPLYISSGVKFVGGSDGSGPGTGRRPGEGALELQLCVDYGMTPMQAIVANTKMGADCMGFLDKFGTLEPGKLADIVVLDGDPLADITILQERERVSLVMKGGEVFRSNL